MPRPNPHIINTLGREILQHHQRTGMRTNGPQYIRILLCHAQIIHNFLLDEATKPGPRVEGDDGVSTK